MKIFLTGSKGIPNQYGGFEQFVQYISKHLASRGHEVSVYNPSFHPYREKTYNKVNIIRKFSPEKIMGGAANYFYDYLCIKDAINKEADIILECGYASAAPAYRLLNFRNSRIITHLDGFEWQRTKWSGLTHRVIKKSERTAVRISHGIVCDHPLINQYFREKYNVEPVCIPYGVKTGITPDISLIESYPVSEGGYYLVVARLEPENKIRTIIEGFSGSQASQKLLIIGNTENSFSRNLRKQFKSSGNVIFLEGIYNESVLYNLRHFSRACFHGHSVGGTNPSLLEAMASGAVIIAHDNPFLRHILNENAMFFNTSEDISGILDNENDWISKKPVWTANNKKLISENYRWDRITDQYEDLFRKVLEGKIVK